MFNQKVLSNYEKSLIERFKNSTDRDIHFECGLNSMNELLWVNLVENGEVLPLKLKEFRKFFNKKLIRGRDKDDIRWLTPEEKTNKTEKIYKCVIIELCFHEDIYEKLMTS